MASEYEYRYRIVEHAADCFEIVRCYRDGLRQNVGLYSSRRDASAELRLIREAE